MEEYEESWPEGIHHQPLKKRLRTMKECKKKTRTDTAEQFNSGLIFARALALMNSRDIKVEQILSYELAPVPTSMFEGENRDLHCQVKVITEEQTSSGTISSCYMTT